MPDAINSLADVRPGDVVFMPMSGAPAKALVYAGQAMLGEYVRIGPLAIGHVGIVTQTMPGMLTLRDDAEYYAAPIIRMVQAMPNGAEEVELRPESHWKPSVAFARMPEDYPGQAQDAAAIARVMIGTPYSFASYAALAAWKWGIKTPRLERWINRRREPIRITRHEPLHAAGLGYPETYQGGVELPAEAICSVLVDQAWSLAGKRVCEGVAHQAVTPGALALQLWRRPGVIWGGAGLG